MENLNVENMSKEQLLKILGQNGIDIKALAQEAKNVKTNGGTKGKKVKEKSIPTWSLVMNDHNDFAIKRELGNKWKMLVVMTSQGTGYFKEKEGTSEIERNSLVSFLRGMPQIDIPDCWCDSLSEGTSEADALICVLKTPILMEAYKYGCGPAYCHYGKGDYAGWSENSWRSNGFPNEYGRFIKAYQKHSKLLRDYKDNGKAYNFIIENPLFVETMEKKWDTRNVRDFLDSYTLSLVEKAESLDGGRTYYYDKYEECVNFPKMNMEYAAFKDYVLYDSYRLGYGRRLDSFMQEWNDTCKMQQKVYGKVKYKYPENLQCMHDMLSYKVDILDEKIDDEKLKKNLEFDSQFEDSFENYVFVCPKCRQDFLDEAEMQQNCLASYVSRVIDGTSHIMFLRHKNDLEHSWITIEIAQDNGEWHIRQQFYARNRSLRDTDKKITEKWVKRINTKKNNKKAPE